MLRPLPYAAPDRLMSIWEARIKDGPRRHHAARTRRRGRPQRMTVAPADLPDLRRGVEAFSLVAGFDAIERT
jgi:hypothetical protein